MEFKQLRYFLTILQAGSFSQAAKRLHIAQPPLSRQIKNLETELHVQLFNRSTNGVQATAAGKLLQTYAEELLQLKQQAEQQIRYMGTTLTGRLRLGMISSAAGVLPTKLAQLSDYYPDIQLDIQEGNTYQLIEKLNHHTLDIAIVRTPFVAPGLCRQKLRIEKMVAVAPHKYAQTLPPTLTLADLEALPLIIYRRFTDVFEQTFYEKNVRPFIACYCDDARTAIQWANTKIGVALVPESVAHAYLGAGMQIHPINYAGWRTQVDLIWTPLKDSEPLLQKFITFMTQ